MLIKYLKDAPQGKTGDVKEVEPNTANVLILTGYAEEHTESVSKPTATKKTTKKTTAKE